MRLTARQRRVLALLDDGHPLDSVGREIGLMGAFDMRTADSLVGRGLATFHVGRFLDCYYRLTREGRAHL